MDAGSLARDVVAGDRRALARALTRIERGAVGGEADAALRNLVAELHPATGSAYFVGITGSPGVGKSTLTSAMVGRWRAEGRTVAVLAVDPSSPFSGGALLGDRVRMQEHALDDGVFVRSMASRGHLGGLSWAAPQGLLVLDAAGFDVVVLETVGVGQAEVAVADVADSTVVVVAPGMGDGVQAAKAGILEIADVFAVNKADREGAARAVRELEEMQALGHGAWPAPIVCTVATTGEGVDGLLAAVASHRAWLVQEDRLGARRVARARLVVRELALAALRRQMDDLAGGAGLDEAAAAVAARRLDPYAAAERLVAAVG